ncbi:hypothetical protein V1514DRAFT_325541 [Lipomyces japonicus]|uniref:uncharacterized protein n=1 Tax=Lipomyces japonicus TaxID=56871 RepID=UPI0034CDE91E
MQTDLPFMSISISESLDDVRAWRERLFAVSQDIVMTPAEWDFYFPFVDNVYKINGRSTNSKQCQLSETMYFQCRIGSRSAHGKGKVNRMESSEISEPERSISDVLDPAAVEVDNLTTHVSADEVFAAALLEDNPTDQHLASALADDHDLQNELASHHHMTPNIRTNVHLDLHQARPLKRTRNRKSRESFDCNMKIKVVKTLNEQWEPVSYLLTRSSEFGHTHDIDTSDKIVRNNRVRELFYPDQPYEGKRLTAKERRAFDVEAVLQQVQARYHDLEEGLRQKYPSDKKRLDTTMRKWVNELQRETAQFLSTPIETLLYN